MAEVVPTIEGCLGRSLHAAFVPELRARMAVVFRERLKPIEGVEALLDRLTLPYCVVSNAPMEKIKLTLGITGLLPRFPPGQCVVIEDIVPGEDAARGAGMRVYGLAPLGGGAELASRGATVIHALSELPDL